VSKHVFTLRSTILTLLIADVQVSGFKAGGSQSDGHVVKRGRTDRGLYVIAPQQVDIK